MPSSLPSGDHELVQIIDSALAEAARKSGEWLVCRPGCTQCCMGPFAINQLDAARLRQGLAELEESDPQRAARVRERARQSVARLTHEIPGGCRARVRPVGRLIGGHRAIGVYSPRVASADTSWVKIWVMPFCCSAVKIGTCAAFADALSAGDGYRNVAFSLPNFFV